MRITRTLYFFILLTGHFFVNKTVAQQYSFIPFSVEEGLAQTQVFDICSDDLGNVWFGTAGGASRFDGENFKSFSSENGLNDNLVSQIISNNGFVWIATQKGITRIKGKQIQSYNLEELTENNNISTIAINQGVLWLGVKDKGIYQIPLIENTPDLKNTTLHHPSESLSIRNLFIDSKNHIWVAYKGYLGFFNKNQWTKVEIPNSTNNISHIAEDSKGHIWISTFNDGVYEYNLESFRNYNQLYGIASNVVRSIYIDKSDNVWLSSKNGLTILENGIPTIFSNENGLENENIRVVTQDIEGNIWLGTDGSGAFRFSGNEFVNFGEEVGLSSVMSIIQEKNGTYWFSTYGEGITEYKNNTFTNYRSTNSTLPNNTIWSSLKDSKDNIWFGSSNGLVKYKNNEFIIFQNTHWLPSNKITSLYEDSTHNIWIGSSKGATLISGTDTTIFIDSLGLNTKNIRSITRYQDKICLGTSNGIFIYNNTSFLPWKHNEAIKNDKVYCLQTWEDGIFIGTGNGLFYFDGKAVHTINLHSSFSANYINFITLESGQHLWIGTNFGIFEIDLSIFNFESNKGITHYTTSDGLKSSETNLNSAFQDNDGDIWMGTGKGLLKFSRKKREIEPRVSIPNIEIEDVQLYLKSTDWNEFSTNINPYNQLPNNLKVNYKKNYFTFFYKAISISRPDELRYKFKLNGFDEDWSPEIAQQSFTYANLPHGNYTFEVIASVDGKNWSSPAQFSFIISKPYFLTWWFFSLCALLLLGVSVGIWKWRTNVNEQKRITEKLVFKSKLLALEQQTLNASMNRHFIFNALNSIQYYINTQDKISANKYLTSFAKLIRKNLDSSSSGKSLVSLSDELERLELYISLEHMRFQNKFDYSITIDPKIDPDKISIPPMFLQPFVENSIWHGILPMETNGKIDINIKYNKYHQVTFVIEDNGIGIENSLAQKNQHSHVSQGMTITSGRIDVLKKITNKNIKIIGPFQINDDSNNSHGTRVIITFEDK